MSPAASISPTSSSRDAAGWRMKSKRKEGIAQLKKYANDKKVPALAKGTTLHLILVQYRGPKMANCELVAEEAI